MLADLKVARTVDSMVDWMVDRKVVTMAESLE